MDKKIRKLIVMEYLSRLSKENTSLVDVILDEEYSLASSEDILSADEVMEANEALSDFLYGTEISTHVRRNHGKKLNSMRLEVIDGLACPESAIVDLDISRLGVVVVRPEALGLADASKDLLRSNGLEVLLDKTTQIDFQQYWALYGPGLSDPDAKYDFPTRTLNYINKDIQILVVAGSDRVTGPVPVSDFITDRLKGRQGSYSPNTLRGDIAYTALKNLLKFNGTSFTTPQYNLALDPIGAYRQLVRGDIASDRMHESADSPLLFYAGQSMHVPDSSEIGRDIRILLTEEEIARVSESLNNELRAS
jgi:hypothetical protein